MKGMELPVNTLIVVIIAIIVVISVIYLFTSVWQQSSYGIALDSAKNSGCQRYISLGQCGIGDGLDISIQGITCDDLTMPGTTIECDELNCLANKCYKKSADELCC